MSRLSIIVNGCDSNLIVVVDDRRFQRRDRSGGGSESAGEMRGDVDKMMISGGGALISGENV